MKLTSFFKGLSLLIILNVLVKPVWIFFIDRQVQNRIGNEEYGNYFALLNLSIVLIFIADAGLSTMLNQRLALTAKENLGNLFRIKFFLITLYLLAGLLIGYFIHARVDILLYILFIQALTSLFVFIRNIITSHQYFAVDAFLSVIDKFLMIIFCGLLIY